MAKIIQLSEASSLALHAMILLSEEKNRPLPVKEIAARISASEAHLAKVVQQLSKAGLVSTARGPKGGVMLAKRPEEVTYLEIYEAIEGQLQSGKCMMYQDGKCPFETCIFGSLLEGMTEEIRAKFAETRLSDHGIKNDGL